MHNKSVKNKNHNQWMIYMKERLPHLLHMLLMQATESGRKNLHQIQEFFPSGNNKNPLKRQTPVAKGQKEPKD